MEPTWAVWYGVGSRRFYAAATWPVPWPLLVQAVTVGELREVMREAEQCLIYESPAKCPTGRVSGRADSFPEARPGPSMIDGVPMPEMRDGGLRTVCWDVPHDLSVIGKMRGMVREVLGAWDLAELTDDVVLAVAELLANAVGHGAPPIRLSLWLSGGDFCVRVTDHGPEQPRYLELDLEAVHGRGLAIVAALATDTGVTSLPDGLGKTIWARWRLPDHHSRSPVPR
ncbi:hypothetical protein Sme01_69580 [Sphaerisporangium melleum]|uniref:Histidine kinase/HSP90-like ATPase domain-containing protein n=1 Tax=Sphaerisporangium melleum TaxID=321316 RepID=A0A917RLK8_9ACTN|nr:ATP-binding protein [Sphaerisporangium melleum]GGL13284.1 hypothetical protein GCM10007964_64240 [Sphaerisporangium melleum]GII74482.1 hypothetical protein Sme01_69580 [Sphaerisporangium melleum]